MQKINENKKRAGKYKAFSLLELRECTKAFMNQIYSGTSLEPFF